MHSFLRSIGFSEITNNKQLRQLIKKVSLFPDSKKYLSWDRDVIWAEYRKSFAPGIGIAVCGEYTEENEFEYEYFFPYMTSETVSTAEEITIERHLDSDAYSGICDDFKLGVTLIFYLQNKMEYLKTRLKNDGNRIRTNVSLVGLAAKGMVVLPLKKDEHQVMRTRKKNLKRSRLMEKAMAGDEEAIESLTMEDMDRYSIVSDRIRRQDVFTLVDTYFMPCGIECEMYSVMGEIEETQLVMNRLTKEEIYIITMNCNDIALCICINKADLMGEPAPRRRFKGQIWLQGSIS